MTALASTVSTQSPPRSSVRVVKQTVNGTIASPPEDDHLAVEDPLAIILATERDGQSLESEYLVTMRTPGNDEDLLRGLLFCQGIIHAPSDITSIDFARPNPHAAPVQARVALRGGINPSPGERRFTVQTSCGICGTDSLNDLAIGTINRLTDRTVVQASLVHELPAEMRRKQDTFEETGGLHAAALFTPEGELIVAREDIGRHNALDKVLGALLFEAGSLPAHARILCVSGRMSYDILQKALTARIPIVAGVGAPSSLAVTLANDFNLTLIGFVRDRRFNLYSSPERILTGFH